MERINSRVVDGFMLHSRYLCGKQSMGTEDHHLHDGDAGGSQFRDVIEQARTDPVTGAVAGTLTRPLRGALSSSCLTVAAAAVPVRANFGPRLEQN